MLKIAYQNIEKVVLQALKDIGGQWILDSRLDTGRHPDSAGKMVHEINLSYTGRGIKMPYDKFGVVIWLQVAGEAETGSRMFNLQFGHKDVNFEVAVFAPIDRNQPQGVQMQQSPDNVRYDNLGNSNAPFHTPQEVAEFVWDVINNDTPPGGDETREPTPSPSSPEFAPVGV